MGGWIGDTLVRELSGGTEELHHLKHDGTHFKKLSNWALKILLEYDPKLIRGSLDEFFVDFDPYLKLRAEGVEHSEIAGKIGSRNKRVADEDEDKTKPAGY